MERLYQLCQRLWLVFGRRYSASMPIRFISVPTASDLGFSLQQAGQRACASEGMLQMQFVDSAHQLQIRVADRTRLVVVGPRSHPINTAHAERRDNGDRLVVCFCRDTSALDGNDREAAQRGTAWLRSGHRSIGHGLPGLGKRPLCQGGCPYVFRQALGADFG